MRKSRSKQRSGHQRGMLLLAGPILLWMAVIFLFSSQPYEKQDLKGWLKQTMPEKSIKAHFSNTIINYGGHEVSIKKSGTAGFVEFFIRKGAHLLIYAVLGILVCRLLKALWGMQPLWLLSGTWVTCFLYAGTDEFHQQFTFHRSPLLVDVFLDSIGALIGAGICLAFFYIYSLRSRL
jgi:VanZ family protein